MSCIWGLSPCHLYVAIGKDADGHATLSTSGCTVDPGSISIEFHGGASWLYNLFDDYLEDTLKSKMQDKVCKNHYMNYSYSYY